MLDVHMTSEGHYLPRPIHFTNHVYCNILPLPTFVLLYLDIYLYIITLITLDVCMTSEGHCLPRPNYFTNHG